MTVLCVSNVPLSCTNASLDFDKATKGMTKEIRAFDSLKVGDPITKAEADESCKTHKIKILSTRWVSVGKKDGKTKEDIVRVRVVARDYASGSPSAAELGISSPTYANEAFRMFLIYASANSCDLVLADVSTAFLFALVVSPECVLLPTNVHFPDNSCVFLKLRKALFAAERCRSSIMRIIQPLVSCHLISCFFPGAFVKRPSRTWMEV